MSKREHDNLYLYDKQYFKKPKFAWEVLKDHLKKNKKKKLKFWDIGCANGSLIFFLKKHFPNWSFIGSDINRNLISESKKKTKEKIIYDNIEKKNTLIKADILHAAGVHSCFTDIKNFLDNIIQRTNKKGEIYIHGSFNLNPVDVVIKYRDCTKKNFSSFPINQTGWNNFSTLTISKILKKNKRVKKFKFYSINFPKNLRVKKTKDPLRSWTISYNNENYFINSLNILQKQHILKIWVK
tara:strand:+ start:365 stop:1081 length:717 start_codon:yes stop_codon:yes gene_type:complete